MARKRNTNYRKSQTTKKTRVNLNHNPNTNRSRLRSSSFNRKLRDYNHKFVEDRRLHNPTSYILKTISGARATIRVASVPVHKKIVKSIPAIRRIEQFNVPKRVMVCVRRKQRKAIMHAFKHAGKGGQRRPRRNKYSNIKC